MILKWSEYISDPGWGPLVSICEYCNANVGSKKDEEFLNRLHVNFRGANQVTCGISHYVVHMGLTQSSSSPQNACPARYQVLTVGLSWLAMCRKSSGDKLRLNSSLETSSKETVSKLSNYSNVLRFRSCSFFQISARL
jgi:hypothetical protein